MKAFLLSILLLIALTAAAAYGFKLLDLSSSTTYTDKDNVRL